MRFECSCDVPNQCVNPRRPDTCVRCSGWINPAWTSNDSTTTAFYDRLSLCLPIVDDHFHTFRAECEARELAGRERFRHRFHGRDNVRDAREEAADGGNYFLMDHLKHVRAKGDDDDFGLVLMGAHYFYLAHKTARHLRHARHGSP